MSARKRGRSTLGQGLDREVHQVVQKIIGERAQFGDSTRVSVTTVLTEIRRSKSSLNRKPKRLIEDSVERVLATIQQDASHSDTDTPDGEGTDLFEPGATTNGMNRSIVGAWGTPQPTPAATATPIESLPREQKPQEKIAVEPNTTRASKRKLNGEIIPRKRNAETMSSIDRSPPTHVNLADLAGVDAAIEQMSDLLVLLITKPKAYAMLKIPPPRGVLIHGPPGCGKTTLANAFAAELGVNFISISAPSIVSGMSGESEKSIREHFEEAKKCAPCLMFIDEIDTITPKRDTSQREMEKRIVAQLGTCMDDISLEKTDGKPVIVLAATNRPDSLDAALRRGGRFDKEIEMAMPSETARRQILLALTRSTPTASDVDFARLARVTPGFAGADLRDLVSTAGTAALKRFTNALKSDMEKENPVEMDTDQDVSPTVLSLRRFIKYCKNDTTTDYSAPSDFNHLLPQSTDTTTDPKLLAITYSDFQIALPQVQPSALREGFASIPSRTFASIGSLKPHIDELKQAIISPIVNPGIYAQCGIAPLSGALLWGPPGCGKTLLAEAVASASHANFMLVKGPELLDKYVGESERLVRQVFARARKCTPVIIFFDEIDALAPRRDVTMSEASARVTNTLLVELDGIGTRSSGGIYVIAATNRPDVIDPAMLRPGRLGTKLFVGLPDAEGRIDILRTLCKKIKNFTWSKELADLAGGAQCEGFSGADLESWVQRAGDAAIRRVTESLESEIGTDGATNTGEGVGVKYLDFEHVLTGLKRSVSDDELERFESLRLNF